MLRNVFCDDPTIWRVTNEHLQEEFGHNWLLLKDRNNKPSIWDPILDATSSWFVWKMFTLNNIEKTVLVHLVLESSANIFFREAHKIMHQYGETDYFKIHLETDEKHELLGKNFLINASINELSRLLLVQQQGWDVLKVACDQIAKLTVPNFFED
jgi:hypothetical protein